MKIKARRMWANIFHTTPNETLHYTRADASEQLEAYGAGSGRQDEVKIRRLPLALIPLVNFDALELQIAASLQRQYAREFAIVHTTEYFVPQARAVLKDLGIRRPAGQ
jgi:hypothetical protein